MPTFDRRRRPFVTAGRLHGLQEQPPPRRGCRRQLRGLRRHPAHRSMTPRIEPSSTSTPSKTATSPRIVVRIVTSFQRRLSVRLPRGSAHVLTPLQVCGCGGRYKLHPDVGRDRDRRWRILLRHSTFVEHLRRPGRLTGGRGTPTHTSSIRRPSNSARWRRPAHRLPGRRAVVYRLACRQNNVGAPEIVQPACSHLNGPTVVDAHPDLGETTEDDPTAGEMR